MQSGLVTPFAGVWIEIMLIVLVVEIVSVTPFAGVWIEITLRIARLPLSHRVTPFAGVWIEIRNVYPALHKAWGHPLRGGVD